MKGIDLIEDIQKNLSAYQKSFSKTENLKEEDAFSELLEMIKNDKINEEMCLLKLIDFICKRDKSLGNRLLRSVKHRKTPLSQSYYGLKIFEYLDQNCKDELKRQDYKQCIQYERQRIEKYKEEKTYKSQNIEDLCEAEQKPNTPLVYDCEVFLHDWIIVFSDVEGKVVSIVHNNPDQVRDVVEKASVLIGFNNYSYDDLILSAILEGGDTKKIKDLNNAIIGGKIRFRFNNNCFESLDTRLDLLKNISLKEIESRLGKSIIESAVPFDIRRPLQSDEIYEVTKYCINDTKTTAELYRLREDSYFKPRQKLLDLLGDSSKYYKRKSTNSIVCQLLTQNHPVKKWNSSRWEKKDFLPENIIEFWEGNKDSSNIYEDEKTGLTYTFGKGGLHCAKPGVYEKVFCLDVTSMYPHLMIQYNILGDLATTQYKGLLDKRVKAKRTNDIVQSNAMKLAINKVYGMLKSDNHYPIDNPEGAQTVVINGQIAIYDLACRLQKAGYKIVQVNTDGVFFCDVNSSDYLEIKSKWETDYGLALEEDYFEKLIQKDVNNYIGIDEKGIVKKVKGQDVGLYNLVDENGHIKHDISNIKNNDNLIAQICLVRTLAFKESPEEIIRKYINCPELFAFTLKKGAFKRVENEDGSVFQNVNRAIVLLKNDDYPFVNLKRVKYDDKGKKTFTKFPLMPDYFCVVNDDLDERRNLPIDENFYLQAAKKKIKNWEKAIY